jgi:hypothetical protein
MASRETYTFGTVTGSSASGQTASVDTLGCQDQINVYAAVSAVTGTVTFNVQVSPDNATWFTHTSTGAIAAAANTLIKLSANIGRYVRVDYVIVTGPVTFVLSGDGINTGAKGRM